MNIDTEWTKGLKEYQKQNLEMYESYFRDFANNDNFFKILEALENKYGSENVTIENDQPDERCKFYQYINVKKGNSDLTFSFLDIDGFDWKFDTERYHKGKRYDLSVYFKDSFPEIEDVLESAELIKDVKKIVNDILKWEQ